MLSKTAKFSFTIPNDSPVTAERGKKVEKTFDYNECQSESEANTVIAEKEWSVLQMVNEALKASARSNAYQAALAPHKASDVKPEDIKERMIRDYIRLGVPEDAARKQVESLLASQVTA